MAGFGLPAGLVLRLLLLLHVGGGLAAPVLVVDLDHLFPWRLIAPLRLCRWLRSRTLAFATGHSPTVHRPTASTRERALEMRYGRRRHGDAITTDARDYRQEPISYSDRMPCSKGAGAAPAPPATAGSVTREGGRDFHRAPAPRSRPRPSMPA